MFGSNSGGVQKPSAAEQMVAKMLGFTPDEMQATITGFRDTIVAVGDQLKRVEDTQAAILAKLEAMGDGNGSSPHGDEPGNGSDTRDGSSRLAI